MTQVFRAIDSSGDWVFGSGIQAYARENIAIKFDIETKLKTFLTECFFNQEVGLDWFQLLSGKSQEAIVLAIKTAIYDVDGVTSVLDVKYSVDLKRKITISYFIDTIYTTQIGGSLQV